MWLSAVLQISMSMHPVNLYILSSNLMEIKVSVLGLHIAGDWYRKVFGDYAGWAQAVSCLILFS